MKTISVKASTNYDIIVSDDLLNKSGNFIANVTKAKKAALVTDDNVNKIYTAPVKKSLEESGIEVCVFVFPHGEASKNSDTLNRLYNFLIDNQITRTDAIVALGGGVTGDLAGFASATYLRGIDFIQIPTSLLAQIDSSVGGKTGIDMPGGKNLIGAFKQPKLVICDISALDTLTDEFFTDGMGEAIKYGMIKDKELFELFMTGDWDNRKEEIISKCISIKRDVVEADEFEKGERMLLNFGHTLGHAIEKAYNYTGITHGKAVAIGMSIITKFSEKNGITEKGTLSQLKQCLSGWDLPFETDIPLQKLAKYCLSDKKRSGDSINIVICTSAGNSCCKKLSINEFSRFLEI